MAAALQQSRSQLTDSIRQRSAEEHAKTMLERARWAAAKAGRGSRNGRDLNGRSPNGRSLNGTNGRMVSR